MHLSQGMHPDLDKSCNCPVESGLERLTPSSEKFLPLLFTLLHFVTSKHNCSLDNLSKSHHRKSDGITDATIDATIEMGLR